MTVFKYILIIALALILVYETVTLVRDIIRKVRSKKAQKVSPPTDEIKK